MKKYLLSLLIMAFLFACSTYEEPIYNNPIDPKNPDFKPPNATLTTSFSSGTTINETSVTINWDGLYDNSQFSFKLDGYESGYSSWNVGKTKTYDYLDEGTYTFLVKEKAGDFEQETPDSITFIIDAVQETALVLKKWHSSVNSGDELVIDVCLESVENLNGLSTKLNFSNNNLELTKIEALKDNIKGNADAVTFISSPANEANNSGIIEIDMLLLGTSNVEFTGNAVLCRLHFNVKETSQTTIEFNESLTKLRNKDNQEIEINLLRGSVIN